MTTPSTAIKKELKQAFPKIKFSVTTRSSGDVSVKWELPVGTNATVAAIKAICSKHETIEHHGDVMNDTSWYSGFSVRANPSYTQERKDWAVEKTKSHNFVGTTWNEKRQHFEESDGRDAYHATKQYYEYLENGVACELVDKYGNEPNAKTWYYEKLNPPAPTPEPEQVEPEVEAPIVPLAIYEVESEVYIQANFPSGNKRHWIDEYRTQATNLCQAKITEVVHLSPEDYQTFIYSFLNDQEWLAKKGGGSSHYVSEKYGNDWDRLFSDELEAKKWRRECYEISLLVTNGTQYVLVNPEGHNYARYVGLQHHATLEWVLEKCNVNLSPIPVEPVATSEPETAEEKMTYEQWEDEEARLETLLSRMKFNPHFTKTEEDQVRAELATLRQLPHGTIDRPTSKPSEPCPYCHSDESASIRDANYRCYVCDPETLPQTESDTTPNWMELYQEWVTTLISQNHYTEIQSYEDWYRVESERKQLDEEEATLEAEIWELQQRLIELQSKHKATK